MQSFHLVFILATVFPNSQPFTRSFWPSVSLERPCRVFHLTWWSLGGWGSLLGCSGSFRLLLRNLQNSWGLSIKDKPEGTFQIQARTGLGRDTSLSLWETEEWFEGSGQSSWIRYLLESQDTWVSRILLSVRKEDYGSHCNSYRGGSCSCWGRGRWHRNMWASVARTGLMTVRESHCVAGFMIAEWLHFGVATRESTHYLTGSRTLWSGGERQVSCEHQLIAVVALLLFSFRKCGFSTEDGAMGPTFHFSK